MGTSNDDGIKLILELSRQPVSPMCCGHGNFPCLANLSSGTTIPRIKKNCESQFRPNRSRFSCEKRELEKLKEIKLPQVRTELLSTPWHQEESTHVLKKIFFRARKTKVFDRFLSTEDDERAASLEKKDEKIWRLIIDDVLRRVV